MLSSGTNKINVVVGQVHQHMFCARLDLAVDDNDGGRNLLVSEVGRSLRQAAHNVQFTRASDLHLHEANMLQSKCGMCSPQVDLVAMPEGPDNPHGNGFWARETPLLTESKAMRVADPAAARAWKISNPASTHPVTGRKDGGAVPRHVKGTRSGWQANLL